MQQIMNVVQIAIAITLVVVILMQVRGQGGGLFGAAQSSYRTRRGVEKLLFQATIVLVGVFITASIVSARVF